jgi:hypothetical protein
MPEPSWGHSGENAYGYDSAGGCAAGRTRAPVLFGESFTGAAGSNKGPDWSVAKS